MIINIIIILLAAMGSLISLYFTLLYYRWIKANQRYIPNFCRMEEETCQQIVSTKEARLFGLPNSLLGMWYYLLVIVAMVIPELIPRQIIIIISAATVATSIYLGYALIVKLRIPCVLCFTSHGINGCILLLLLSQL